MFAILYSHYECSSSCTFSPAVPMEKTTSELPSHLWRNSAGSAQSTEPHQPGPAFLFSVVCMVTVSIFLLSTYFCLYILNFFIYLLLKRGEGKEKERERNINVWEINWLAVSHTPWAGDLTRNPGVCPDWESNQWPFSLQAGAQSTEPHQPGICLFI